MKISVLLPYKENYSVKNAGAVSLFVKDINNNSKFKKTTTIYGSTKSKNFLSKNYFNLKLEKKIFSSSNKRYVKKFIEVIKNKGPDIIEVHNRPSYINEIRKKYDNKIFLYFHNDPLTMDGSKNFKDRENL